MLKSVRVRNHMSRHPILVNPDTELFTAIHQILVNKISGVTVVDEHSRPVGVLSELDCLKAILHASYHGEEVGFHKVSDHMSEPVESVGPDDGLIEVAQSMIDHKRRRRPVIDEHGLMVGQLTCRQLLRAIKDMDMPKDRTER